MKILSTFALGSLLLIGCGGSDILGTDDAGGTTADMASPLYKLQSGQYVVTSLTVISDGCMVNPNDAANPTVGIALTLTNDGAGNIGLGKVGGTPPEPSNGASCPGNPVNAACATAANPLPFSDNQGTLVRDNNIDDGAGCTEHRHVENLIPLTADNTFTSSYTNTDSNHVGCTVTADCTTTYTWSFTKQ